MSESQEQPWQSPDVKGLALLLLVTAMAFSNYAGLLSVVPMWAAEGGAASVAVGVTTGVMMGATVAAQMVSPWLVLLMSLRGMMVLGAVLLGAPTPLYVLSDSLLWILLITAVRGVGFAMVVVAGAALVAELAGMGKLSTVAALYGAAGALPNLAALPGGVWVARTVSFEVVFWGAGIACLAAAGISVLLPAVRTEFSLSSLAGMGRVLPPLILFLITAAGFGALTTFLPLAGPDAGQAAAALLVASIALVAGRLGAGFLGRTGAGRLVVLATLLGGAGLGLLGLSLQGPLPLLLLGAALVGAGFGAAQNDSFVVTVERFGPGKSGAASTVWNVAYDGGFGVGAVALGGVIGAAGYGGAFAAMAAAAVIVAVAVPLATRGRGA